MRAGLLVILNMSANERAYVAYRGGVIGANEWTRIQRSICAEFSAVPTRMHDLIDFMLTDDFREYLEKSCTQDN